jgi:hypothetical protein
MQCTALVQICRVYFPENGVPIGKPNINPLFALYGDSVVCTILFFCVNPANLCQLLLDMMVNKQYGFACGNRCFNYGFGGTPCAAFFFLNMLDYTIVEDCLESAF